jgi:hypothetical protein
MVRCKLTVMGVTKEDAGEASQEDEPLKSAVSDALKRAAVHFGIGRYLYYLPRVWAPFDPQKRRFIEQPRLDPAAVRRALALCGVVTEKQDNARQELPSGPLASPAEARANREAPAPESRGDRKATERPPTAQQPRQQASAPTQAAQEARPQRPPVTESSVGNLHCQREGCGATLTRGQHDVSVRSFGKPYCPACQKTQTRTTPEEPAAKAETPAANGREKTPLDNARAAYMVKLHEKFGAIKDPQRYAIEAVLLGMNAPLQAGSKADWQPQDWDWMRDKLREIDKDDVLRAAEQLVNDNRNLEPAPAAHANYSGLRS